ncbi:MAG: hypothetical protein JRE64_15890 [Deltaproteobacteria bacterium]|nr:hypothetical protein [Deltaproteobacteria bacterium]
MIITSPIEAFFKNPNLEPLPEGDCILFHLRRDLIRLYGAEGKANDDVSLHTMLAMMGILAGIDYLSKVYSRHQGPKKSRKRFVETIQELCSISNEDSEAVYQFRCALVHSVSLSTISSSYKSGERFNFDVNDEISQRLVEKLSDSADVVHHYRISFWKLKEAFLEIIEMPM